MTKVFEFDGHPAQKIDFELKGDVIRCNPDVDSLDVLVAVAGLTSDSGIEQIRTLSKIFDKIILPEDQDKFRDAIGALHLQPAELTQIADYALGEYMRFPTEPVSSSSDGPSTTG
jgi:hypothetical protein